MTKVIEKKSVSTELAHRMIEAGERRAAEMGQAFVIAVVDESGVLKALSRMDGAPLIALQVAQYTAAGWGMPSGAWHDFISNDPPLAAGAVGGIDRLVIFGGGFPITVDGTVVGAVGVSGAHYTQDMEVAKAAVAAAESAAASTR